MEHPVDWSKIIDLLPVAVSIQTPERKLIYENKKMKSLFGDQPRSVCYHRFNRSSPCKFCALNVALGTGKMAHVYVKTVIDGSEKFLELFYHPLYDETGNIEAYIEVVHELPHLFLPMLDVANQFSKIPFSIAVLRFGEKGSQIVHAEEFPFPIHQEEIEAFMSMLGVHWFASINQGNNINLGFYGPIPVSSHNDFVSYAALTKIHAEDSDPRLKGEELILTMIFAKKKHTQFFNYHEELYDVICESYSWIQAIENINEQFISDLKSRIIDKWIEIFPIDFPIQVGKLTLL